MVNIGNDEEYVVPVYNSSATPHGIARQDDGIGHLDRLQLPLRRVMKTLELYSSTTTIIDVRYLEEIGTHLGPTFDFYALMSREDARYNSKIGRDGNPLRTNTAYLSHLRERFTVRIDTGHDTNKGNAASIGHARSNYAQARHQSTKGYESLDHTLTLADPMRILKTCFVMPPNTTTESEEKDDRPEHVLVDGAGIEAGATTRDQLPDRDSAASVAPQLTDQPDNDHRYVFPRNALEQPRSPDELTTRTPIPDHRNTSTRSIAHDDVQQPRHVNSTQANHPRGSQRYRPYDPATQSDITPAHDHNRLAEVTTRIRHQRVGVVYQPPSRIDSRSTHDRPQLDPAAEERAEYALRDYEYPYDDARTRN
ncbi:hypothetical protein EDB89DRAFT_2071778 [Lactarius sanguifluus]|nr:hypothetical protein EDB89DRAFT_2071778 [Lactarius sanguifluus]